MPRPSRKPLPRIPVTPRLVNRSCLPIVVNTTSRHPTHPLNTEIFGHHEYMDKIFLQELSQESGAMIVGVEGIPAALFPDHAFAVSVEDLFRACVALGFYDAKRKRWVIAPNFSAGSQEREIAQFFEKLRLKAKELFAEKGEIISDKDERYWTAAYRDNVLPGGVTERKPDLIELLVAEAKTWGFAFSDLQHKASRKELNEAAKQLHDGGLNTLSLQDDRIFHIGLGLVGPQCFIARYDRSGCVRSAPFDVHKKPKEFLKALIGLSLLDSRFLGRDTSITTNDNGRFVTVAGVLYRIISRVNEDASIRGLGPILWLCDYERPDGTREEVLIKGAWVDTTRVLTEAACLEMARDKQVRGVPTFIASEPVMRQGAAVSTEYFRTKVLTSKQLERSSEFRVYTRTVMIGNGSPLSEFRSKAELLGGLLDGVVAHLDLLDKCGILHGDIRDSTILLDNRVFSSHGLRRGFIADISCPIKVGEMRTEASKGPKSCGAAFMAGEMLLYSHLFPHEPRHDLESFVHVLIWTCALHDGSNKSVRTDGLDIMKTPLGKWLSTDLEAVGAAKEAVMHIRPEDTDPFLHFLDEVIHPYFEDFKDIIWDLRMAVMRPEPRVTHQEVIGILTGYLDIFLAQETLLLQQQPATRSAEVGNDLDTLKNLSDVPEPGWDTSVGDARPSGTAEQEHTENVCQPNIPTNLPSAPAAAHVVASVGPAQIATSTTQVHSQGNVGPTRNTRAALKRTVDNVASAERHVIYRDPCLGCRKKVPEDEEGAIRCTQEGCTIEWFHRECVKSTIDHFPEGEWKCSDCVQDHEEKKRARTQSTTTRAKAAKRPSKKTKKTVG